MSKIADRLRLLREEKKLSQQEFADKMGVNRMTINNYEMDKRTPDVVFAIKAADFFEVTVEFISGKSDFRDKEDFAEAVQNIEFLTAVIEMLPKETGRSLTNTLRNMIEVMEMAHVSDATIWLLSNIFNLLKQLIANFTQADGNWWESIRLLRDKGVDDETIGQVIMERPDALYGMCNRITIELANYLHVYTKLLIDKVGIFEQEHDERHD